jgi:pyrroline-5-carboxylate reductase
MISQNIILVGCGKMGTALFGGLLPHLKSKSQAVIVSPSGEGFKFGVSLVKNPQEIPSNFNPEIVLFAVKPQILDTVLPLYKNYADSGETLFISIAAGKTLKSFAKHLGEKTPIIRAMPNLPALIACGTTTICANNNVNKEQKSVATALFESVGSAIWLEDESLMDVATGVAGSGPAYVFHFIECLTNAGMDEGMPQEIAANLAINTVLGSAKMAANSTNIPTQLKQQVISPNGTTQAGMYILSKDNALENLIKQTVKAATKRSKELAS